MGPDRGRRELVLCRRSVGRRQNLAPPWGMGDAPSLEVQWAVREAFWGGGCSRAGNGSTGVRTAVRPRGFAAGGGWIFPDGVTWGGFEVFWW